MRTLVTSLWSLILLGHTMVSAQQRDIAVVNTRENVPVGVAAKSTVRSSRTASTRAMASKAVAMPKVQYYVIADGEDEDFPPGLYATFQPTAPDTVTVFTGSGASARSYNIDAGMEMIHGDSSSVFSEVELRRDAYARMGSSIPTKTGSFVTRSGYIPIERLGGDRFKFAVKPSHFRIAPGAMISASVQLEGDEDLTSVLCTVSAIDYEHNAFTIETSRTVPIGETINWVIVNFPE